MTRPTSPRLVRRPAGGPTTRLAALLLGAALVAGSCSGEDADPTPAAQGSPPSTADESGKASARPDPGSISPQDLPSPPQLRRSEGAVADVEYDECATRPGRQRVAGTVTNSARRTRDYVITLSWTNDTFDVLGRGIAVVRDLEAGAATGWTVTAEVPRGVTTCTPNVVRGSLRG